MTRNCRIRSCREVAIRDGNLCSEHVREMLYETRRESAWVVRAREGRLMPKVLG